MFVIIYKLKMQKNVFFQNFAFLSIILHSTERPLSIFTLLWSFWET